MSENTSRKEIEDYAKDYENLFLSTQTILLGVIVAHEASLDYGVWFLVIYLFIWDFEANSFYILLTLSIFWKHFSWKYHFFCFALLSVCEGAFFFST